MPFGPKPVATSSKMQVKLSTWTPLNHSASNSKVFQERRSLLVKWFDRWSDRQRREVLQDLVLGCSVEQLRFLCVRVSRQLPLQAADFTCLLPRTLCLYIFSFLDPRSLSRCAQVSWHWRSIVELDRLWMPKCVRLGWCIPFTPSPLEQGAWKRLYIQTVQEMQLTSPQQSFVVPVLRSPLGGREDDPDRRSVSAQSASRTRSKKETPPTVQPPWRNSDKHPKDTVRFNYLDNLELTEQLKSGAPTCSSRPASVRKKTASEANYRLRKAKSLMFLQHPPPPPPPQTQCRPPWASRSHPVTKETARSLLRLAQWNAGICPGPVRTAVPRLSAEALRASQRSSRSFPSVSPLLSFSSGLKMM